MSILSKFKIQKFQNEGAQNAQIFWENCENLNLQKSVEVIPHIENNFINW